MTFRAKPVVKRAHRPAWEGQDRRNFYLNIAFGLIVLAAVIILAVAASLAWYNDHLAPVGSVDGQNITKDEYRDRVAIEAWRMDEAERRIRTAVQLGHLTDTEGQTQQQILTQQRNQVGIISLERLIDQKLQAKLATEEGVSATPADIDAKLAEEATTPETRHAWVIEVKPLSDLGSIGPTDAQKAAAKAKAEQALKDIQGGKSWEDVAKTVSTDAASAPKAGDIGLLQADDSQADEPYLKAIFAAPINTPTAVIEGTDQIYRIGRVTEINPATVDPDYQAKIVNDKIDMTQYRAVVAGDVIHDKLQDKIVAEFTGPAPQRHVAEIYIKDDQTSQNLGSTAIKVRHILYAPKDDPNNASTLPADDPAWSLAQAEATAAYQKIKDTPGLFDSIARTESDESPARGASGTGGKLPYFDKDSQIDPAFKAAIFGADATPGALLPPVKSAFGWHVIQIMYKPTDIDHLGDLKKQADGGADFGLLARDNSDAPSASYGGDLGWVANGQLDDRLTAAIFGTEIGKTSNPVVITNDGVYLFKVFAEETRTPEGRQLAQLKTSAFNNWYDLKKSTAAITRDPSITGATQ
jgi:parvulin-like peptidyl-prolyl isomerase